MHFGKAADNFEPGTLKRSSTPGLKRRLFCYNSLNGDARGDLVWATLLTSRKSKK